MRGFHRGNPLSMPLRLPAMLAAALAAVAISAAPASAALHLSPIGTFTKPVYITAPPGDPHRVFVVEQVGRIIEVRDGVKQDPAFLDITSRVKSAGGEQGLLSMAFAPDYASSGRYYVYYTAPRAGDSGGSVITVEEFSPTEHHVVFTVDHPTNSNHNGGQLQFGPDGLLYAGTGDGGSGNDPPDNAQNRAVNLGKLLRVDPTAPGATPEQYAYGLRNPFRFSFDRQTGDLIIGDVGQGAWEEVDFSPAGTASGRDYGWHCREGKHPTPGVTCTPPEPVNPVDPVLEKDHSTDGFCAIIGGYVVRDASLGSLAGRYVYGDNCAPDLRSVTLPAANDDAATGLTVDGLSSFGEDSCGHVYATSLNGPVYRIDGDSFSPCPEPPAGGGGGGTPPPGGGGSTPPDTTPPSLTLSAWPDQHALRNKGFWVRARCTEVCGVTVTGTMRIGRQNHVYKLKRTTRLVAANQRQKVTLNLWNRGMRALRSALENHRRVTATLSATALDAAKNPATASRSVRGIR
jgi:glucose/arabinose dehydrogenase